jgi:hypothetical protein
VAAGQKICEKITRRSCIGGTVQWREDQSSQFFVAKGAIEKVYFDKNWESKLESIYFPRGLKSIRKDYPEWIRVSGTKSYRSNTVDYLFDYDGYSIQATQGDPYVKNRGGRPGIDNSSQEECWLFGGSTVFGDRLLNYETLSSQLNTLQSKFLFVNYGIPGFNSNSQLQYLTHLLKKRNIVPRCVVWLDGLNDGTFIHLRPVVSAFDRSSHNDIDQQIGTLNTSIDHKLISKFSTVETFTKIFNRDSKVMNELDEIRKFQPKTLSKIDDNISRLLYTQVGKVFEDQEIFNEAAKNHLNNARIARGMLRQISNERTQFFWFIQPNGELNKLNPFLLEGHFTSNRFLVNLYYQKHLVNLSNAFAIDLSSVDANCTVCYVDEGHYSPQFLKIIAEKIWTNMNGL